MPQHLYHYTFLENVDNIIKVGLKPSIKIPENPKSDAQWGNGHYLTDLTPLDASFGTRWQVSRALFATPWHWGTPPSLKPIGWIQMDTTNLALKRVATLFTKRFPERFIYLHPSTETLNITERVMASGTVVFQASSSGYR